MSLDRSVLCIRNRRLLLSPAHATVSIWPFSFDPVQYVPDVRCPRCVAASQVPNAPFCCGVISAVKPPLLIERYQAACAAGVLYVACFIECPSSAQETESACFADADGASRFLCLARRAARRRGVAAVVGAADRRLFRDRRALLYDSRTRQIAALTRVVVASPSRGPGCPPARWSTGVFLALTNT